MTQDDLPLRGKVSLVTGGSRGIGAAIAKRLAAEGARVAVCYANDETAARQTLNEIEANGGEGAIFRADLSDKKNATELVSTVAENFGSLDVLVNNAAVVQPQSLEDIDHQTFEEVFDINVRAPLFAIQAAIQKFSDDGGSIVNISSINGISPVPGAAVYSASKAALNALTVSFAHELGSRNIRVNAIAPGATSTDNLNQVMSQSVQNEVARRTAMGRIAQPDDIAAAVSMLLKDDAAWITGQIITASGGFR